MLAFLEVGFGGNLVQPFWSSWDPVGQGFRAYAWRTVPSFPQIALCFPSFALRPQPLSDFNKNHLLHKLYDEEKEKLDTYWLGAFNPLLNGIKKLPLTVSQWSLVLPKCTLGWLLVMHRTGGGYPWIWKHRRTAENIGKHLKSSDMILRTTEDPS